VPYTTGTHTISAVSNVDPTKAAQPAAAVTVINDPPVCAITPQTQSPFIQASAPNGSGLPTVTIEINPCTDTENDIPATGGYTIDWGDGSTATVASPANQTHTYSQNSAQFTITLTATDTSNAVSVPLSTTISFAQVGNGIPTIVSGQSSQPQPLTLPTGWNPNPTNPFECTAIEPIPSNLPPLSQVCTFNVSSQPPTLTINAIGSSGSRPLRSGLTGRPSTPNLYPWALFLPSVVLFGIVFGSWRNQSVTNIKSIAPKLIALGLLIMAAVVLLPSCGGGGFPGQVQQPPTAGMPAGNYSLTVQATGTINGTPATNYYVVPFTVI